MSNISKLSKAYTTMLATWIPMLSQLTVGFEAYEESDIANIGDILPVRSQILGKGSGL